MKSLNEQIEIIRAVAERHLQLNTVITDERFEQSTEDVYPLLHIVTGNWSYDASTITQRFALICLDLGSEDGDHRADNLNDTQLVLIDILATLQTESLAAPKPWVKWETFGEAQKIVDGRGDNASGWIIEIEAIQMNQREACMAPMTE